ncbi:MAG TPA: NAD-dependent protein deacylase [Lentisphaeria bacterium]|nr:MAG: hypothetical protein A2X47_10015 [Lentisphaerae bacterium GWF2_38_69]HBM16950.1 NAD-dependent protein deacylase [Lentisphaeria bacterium]
MNTDTIIKTAADLISKAKSILFITGAGISADSGLPTYRGLGGLYDGKLTDEGYSIEEALSSDVMSIRPDITWKYLWQIGSHCIKAEPNSAHLIISKIQEIKPDTWVLTQNIDSLHKKAGNKNLIEIHGDAFELSCTKCRSAFDALVLFPESGKMPQLPPKCAKCGGMIRPNVVLFGEMLPEKAIKLYYRVLESRPELIISIGTSGMFPYITGPIQEARKAGQRIIEINPCFSSITDIVDIYIPMPAAKAMKAVWEELTLNTKS